MNINETLHMLMHLAGGYGVNVASVGWQVILCDPVGQVNSRNDETIVDKWPLVRYHLTRVNLTVIYVCVYNVVRR